MREFLKDVWMHGGEESRAITPENITGEKGRAAMSASRLGVGRKGSCCVPLESGETITLADIEGPGIIRHIWMTVPDKTAAGSFVMRDLVLRFYWDDEETPSVECPVGDFFCNGFGERAIVNSMPICVNPTGGMNCYFEMPFRKHARVTLTSEHPGFIKYIFYTFNYALTDVPDDAMYFHARFNRERSTRRGVDYTVLDGVRGKGYYVGTYMALCALERYWWGEGEMKFFLDGDEEFPTVTSTGAEDYFGGAWAFLDRPPHALQHAVRRLPVPLDARRHARPLQRGQAEPEPDARDQRRRAAQARPLQVAPSRPDLVQGGPARDVPGPRQRRHQALRARGRHLHRRLLVPKRAARRARPVCRKAGPRAQVGSPRNKPTLWAPAVDHDCGRPFVRRIT